VAVIPEPSSLALLVFAGVTLALCLCPFAPSSALIKARCFSNIEIKEFVAQSPLVVVL